MRPYRFDPPLNGAPSGTPVFRRRLWPGIAARIVSAVVAGSGVVNLSSVMGGVKVRVPEDWTVVSRVNSVLGGFKDETRPPKSSGHRLILKGTVVMGGLKVTN